MYLKVFHFVLPLCDVFKSVSLCPPFLLAKRGGGGHSERDPTASNLCPINGKCITLDTVLNFENTRKSSNQFKTSRGDVIGHVTSEVT